MEKSRYIHLMEITLSAYSYEHIQRYYNDVKKDGLKEHGFPRLTANIGILLAHGRRLDLKNIFLEMMDLCCKEFPKGKAANDFSVKEIIFSLQELEKSSLVEKERMEKWKELLKTIDPYSCYDVYARSPDSIVHNWAAFTMLSEYMRQAYALTDSYRDFIDLQACSQLRHLDENHMYRDPAEPMVYDWVTRGLFALLLDQGYEGKYKEIWQKVLDDSASHTLLMQSVTGEIPYGGRSSQFIHNEGHIALLDEYYAKRFKQKGDLKRAGIYKAAAERALENISFWLSRKPISHVKNRFPVSSEYGCEFYAYFDKYMITAASFLYAAYRICDDSIPTGTLNDLTGAVWQSSAHFHKLFFRAGEYFAEYDYNADYHYDCSGLGRLHKKGAPSQLCLSVPCPVNASYKMDIAQPHVLAIAPGICNSEGVWQYAAEPQVKHIVSSHEAKGETAQAEIRCIFPWGKEVKGSYFLDCSGLKMDFSCEGALRCLLPVFHFNGEEYTRITHKENSVEISFGGYICSYTVFNGRIIDLKRPAGNRNGHYKSFAAEGQNSLNIHVSIRKMDV